jgi:hypothetical protein
VCRESFPPRQSPATASTLKIKNLTLNTEISSSSSSLRYY